MKKFIKGIIFIIIIIFILCLCSSAVLSANDVDWSKDSSLKLRKINLGTKPFAENIRGENNFPNLTPQGMTVTNKYIVFTLMSADDQPTTIVIADKATGKVLKIHQNNSKYMFGHANDMAYDSKNDVVYVTTSTKNLAHFKINSSYDLVDFGTVTCSHTFGAIAYNSQTNEFLGRVSSTVYIMDSAFKDKSHFTFKTTLTKQGMAYYNNNVYLCAYEAGKESVYQTESYNSKEQYSNLIYKYDLKGNLQETLHIPYTTLNGELESCAFDSNGEFLAYYALTIDGKRRVNLYKTTSDVVAPTLSLSLSPSSATNQNVTATITSNEPVQQPSGWTYGANNKTLTKVFKTNGSETVTVHDTAGNPASILVKVSNIDKDPPTLSLSLSPNSTTNQNVTATITSNEPVEEPSGWTYGANNKTLTKLFTSNDSETVTVYDKVGNHANISVNVNFIDKSKPNLSVSYSPSTTTNQNVTATITSDKPVREPSGWTYGANNKTLTKLFTSNDSETVTVYDQIGNYSTIFVNVNFIDKDPPRLSVNLDPSTSTNQNVTATITSNEPVEEPSGWTYGANNKTLTKLFTSNDSETVTVYDKVGNHANISVNVNFIDKSKPNLSVSYSPSTTTNQNVTATITSDKPVREPSGWTYGANNKTLTKLFTSNDSETVTVYDQIGNYSTIFVNVNFIDKDPPRLSVNLDPSTPTNQDVTATITSTKAINPVAGWILGNDNKTLTKVFKANDSEEVTVYDLVGNSSSIFVNVDFIDKKAPTLTPSYSTTLITNQDVTATITSDEPVKQVNGWTLDTTQKVLTKVFKANDSEEVTVYDLVGNESKITINVENIDKMPPVLTATYKPNIMTNQDVEVTITSNEQVKGIEGWTLSEDEKILTKIYAENKKETVTTFDKAGNSSSIDIKVENIDKKKPSLKVDYSTTLITNKDVEVTISSDEELKELKDWVLSKDKKALTKVYPENKDEEITVFDAVGNENKVKISVKNIDKIDPIVKVIYSNQKITNRDVDVTISSNEELQEIEGWALSKDKKSLTKTYSKNKEEDVSVSDLAGNIVKSKIQVTNIDKQKPEIKVNYSTTSKTNKDVIVTITSNEELQEVQGWTLSKDKKTLTKTYSNNLIEEFEVFDLAGNRTTVNVSVTNIDKSEPKASSQEKIQSENIENKDEEQVNNSLSPNQLPYAGRNCIIIIALLLIITSIVIFIKLKKYKDIK